MPQRIAQSGSTGGVGCRVCHGIIKVLRKNVRASLFDLRQHRTQGQGGIREDRTGDGRSSRGGFFGGAQAAQAPGKSGMSGLRLGKLIAKAKKGPVPLASTRHIHTRLLSGLHWIEYLVILLSPKGRETQRRLLMYSQDEQASSRQGWQCNRRRQAT